MADLPVRVTCRRCKEPLLVWEMGGRFYVGCPFKGCPLTPLEPGGEVSVAAQIVMAARLDGEEVRRG